jgi:hypothetical protein
MFERRMQLSILLENVPGRFAEVCEMLYERGVDIQAMTATPIGESGILRMVVDDAEAAVAGLDGHKLAYLETEVVVARVPNQAGMAAGIGHRFSQARVNIEYTYFSSGQPGTQSLMVFKVADVDDALTRLRRMADSFN